MLAALKSEFLKLLTVRSTYVITAIALLLVIFFAGYIEGYKASPDLLKDTGLLARQVTAAINFVAIFAGIIAILLFSHEYRYNTILHTLVSANSRTKVLAAKIIAMTVFALLFGLSVSALSPLASVIGIQLADKEMVAQTIPYADLLWRCLLFIWGFAMIGLILVALTRNQVLAFVSIFLIPTVIEPIISALIKKNQIYLPFFAHSSILADNPALSHAKGATIFLIELAVLWLIAWVLFLRRDAS